MVKITGSTPLCNYCFGYIGTLIRKTWGEQCCKYMLKDAYTFICFLPKHRVWELWILYYRLLSIKFVTGCIWKQVGWIGEEKILESAGHLEKKNSVCQKLQQGKTYVNSVCNICVDKLSVCGWQKSTMVQVKLLKHRCPSSSASTNLRGCKTWSFETLWAGPSVSLDSSPTTGSTGGLGTQMPKWYWLDMNPAKLITLSWDTMW